MKWVTAADLGQWADRRDARTGLSELVSALVRASSARIEDFRFPTGDSAQIPGYDGRLEAAGAPPFVPGGRSVWEFGTSKDYLAKANEDFRNRSQDPGGVDPADATFVLVTPRTWSRATPSIEEWQNKKKSKGPWKDVRLLDGVQLEAWLEGCPAVAAHFARSVSPLMPANGARSTDEYWEEYAARFEPPLTEAVLLCGRAGAAKRLLERLVGAPGHYRLWADSPEEAAAFAVAAIRRAGAEARKFLEARTLILDTVGAARQLQGLEGLVLVAHPPTCEAQGALGRRSVIVVPLGAGDRAAGDGVALERPNRHEMAQALREMGITPDEAAVQMARKCGRSVTVLARQIASTSAPRPAWAGDTSLVPALLLGGWDAGSEHDREVARTIAGAETYDAFEAPLRKYLAQADSPLECVGDVWQLRAPVDAFAHMAHLIGKEQLDRLGQCIGAVFQERDPGLDLEPRERPFAATRGAALGHSDWLRDGMATTLLLFAALEEGAELRVGGGAQAYVDRLVRALPGLGDDWRLLASLQKQLPLLMEAAPHPLLEALAHLLEGDGGKILPIFQDTDPIFSSSPHTGLLWALEVAAWDPQFFPQAVSTLAALARIDPGGELTNRPRASLRDIFLPWRPRTNAPLRERLAVLDGVLRAEPRVGWELLLDLMPEQHGFSMAGVEPRFRDAGTPEREVPTNGVVLDGFNAVIDRAITAAAGRPERLCELIGAFPQLGRGQRDGLLDRIREFAEGAADKERARVWDALRDLVNTHKAFGDAAWAMGAGEVALLEPMVAAVEPRDAVLREGWLFDEHVPRLPTRAAMESGQQIQALREAAVGRLIENGGPAAVERLAESAKLPRFVGLAAAAVVGDIEGLAALADFGLRRGGALDEFAAGLSAGAARSRGPEWRAVISRGAASGRWTPVQLVTTLLLWDDEPRTWDFAASLGEETDRAYWLRKPAFGHYGDPACAEVAARKYLVARRATGALGAIMGHAGVLPPDLVVGVLDAVLAALAAPGGQVGAMLAFEVEGVIRALRSRPDVSVGDIARLEYGFLPLLSHREGHLTLHRGMAVDPELFVSVLCDVFGPAGGGAPGPDEHARRRAQAGYQLLHGMTLVPGVSPGGFDSGALGTWVDSARARAAARDRARIADEYIGHVLAYAPFGADGAWPHEAVRALLERLQSDDIEQGIMIQRHNMRGVVHKAMYEGGDQERGVAEQVRRWARAVAAWPRTGAMLRRLADSWDDFGKREDERAAKDKMRFEQ